MDNKVSVISIIVKDEESAGRVNELLHEFKQYIVGRMGIPYRDRGVSIISVVLDAPGGYNEHSVREVRNASRCQCEDIDG